MKHGISYLPEDRKLDGIVGDLSVRDNIILALQVMKGFFKPFSKAQAEKFADEYIELLNIKTASQDTEPVVPQVRKMTELQKEATPPQKETPPKDDTNAYGELFRILDEISE